MDDNRVGDQPPGEPGGALPGDYSAPGLDAGAGQQPSGGVTPPAATGAPGGGVTPPQAPVAGGGGYPGVPVVPPQHPAQTLPLPGMAATGGVPGAPQGAGAPPPPGIPPLPRQTKQRNGGGVGRTFLVAIVAAIIGALLVLAVMPWGFGVSPWDLVRGKLRKAETSGAKNLPREIVKIVSPTEGAVSVASIAQKITPSIVNIDIRTAPQRGSFLDTGAQEGTGSGVIYSADGYILTNNHVVRDAQEITVTLASGQELKGKKVGADPDNDVAVVKVEKTGLPALKLGNSDSLKVGELVVAVGSPFGFEQSVTAGIISALHRSVSAGEGDQASVVLTDLIQTDAAINPGNSGGALCDSRGRLVGLNTLIATAAGGSEGVGFAIPMNNASRVADDIIAGRPVSHPYIGILGQSVSKSIATEYNLPVEKGAYVTRVVPGGPADKAGIKTGDIIVEVDGKQVSGMDDVVSAVRKRKVGDKVSVTYYSGNDRKTAEVTLEEKPKSL